MSAVESNTGTACLPRIRCTVLPLRISVGGAVVLLAGRWPDDVFSDAVLCVSRLCVPLYLEMGYGFLAVSP